ncbi:MAG: hypothetical protein IKE24_01475 [Clostridia bacterium]|nr:hypothetical protein [Clostridia bacterium]
MHDLLPWRQELLALLSPAEGGLPSLRRDLNRDWLFAFDLRRYSPESVAALVSLAADGGWESQEIGGWLHLRKPALLSPEQWMPLLPEGEESAAIRRLLLLHPALRPDPLHVLDLLKALDKPQPPRPAERECRLIHQDLAAALRTSVRPPSTSEKEEA